MQSEITILIDHRTKSTILKRVLYAVYKQQTSHVCETIVLCSGNAREVRSVCAQFSNNTMISFNAIDVSDSFDLLTAGNNNIIVILSDKTIVPHSYINAIYNAVTANPDCIVYPAIIPESEIPLPAWISNKTLAIEMQETAVFAFHEKHLSSSAKSRRYLTDVCVYIYIPAQQLSLWNILLKAYCRGKSLTLGGLHRRSSSVFTTAYLIVYHLCFKHRCSTRVDLLRRYFERMGYLLTNLSKRYNFS